MPKAKFSRQYDYRKGMGKMTSYPSGYEGDVPQSHYDAAVEAGAIEGATPAAAAGGGDSTGTGGKPGK